MELICIYQLEERIAKMVVFVSEFRIMSQKAFLKFWILPALLMLLNTKSSIVSAQANQSMNLIKSTTSMNSSEIAIIDTIKVAANGLATKRDDPKSIAIQLGHFNGILWGGYEVEPFNTDLESIRIGTDGSLPNPPYPAYNVNLELKRKAPISIKALEKEFGSYKEGYRDFAIYETIIFEEPLPDSCALYVDYIRGENQEISDGKIIRIYLVR